MVKTLGNQFLARSALADHKYGAIERRGTARPLDSIEERQALPDELVCPLHRSFEKKSARLLVADPTIWQGFSWLFFSQNGEFLI